MTKIEFIQCNCSLLNNRNEDLQLLVSDEFGVIPASTRLQIALATVANKDDNVNENCLFVFFFYKKIIEMTEFLFIFIFSCILN